MSDGHEEKIARFVCKQLEHRCGTFTSRDEATPDLGSDQSILVADLAMKVAGEIGQILGRYAGVVREAKRVVRITYVERGEWDVLKEAIAALADELERAGANVKTG